MEYLPEYVMEYLPVCQWTIDGILTIYGPYLYQLSVLRIDITPSMECIIPQKYPVIAPFIFGKTAIIAGERKNTLKVNCYFRSKSHEF